MDEFSAKSVKITKSAKEMGRDVARSDCDGVHVARTIQAMAERTVLLMGLRGSGKSTLGRRLAEMLGRVFVDLDDVTAAHLGGKTVTEVWERVGESGFREAEAEALAEVLARDVKDGQIIALGRGTPTAPGANTRIRMAVDEGVCVVYLRASPASLRTRLEASDIGDRPSLTGVSTLNEIETVFNQRDELYTSLATNVLNTDDLNEMLILAKLRDLAP